METQPQFWGHEVQWMNIFSAGDSDASECNKTLNESIMSIKVTYRFHFQVSQWMPQQPISSLCIILLIPPNPFKSQVGDMRQIKQDWHSPGRMILIFMANHAGHLQAVVGGNYSERANCYRFVQPVSGILGLSLIFSGLQCVFPYLSLLMGVFYCLLLLMSISYTKICITAYKYANVLMRSSSASYHFI